jgi:hypothetical protein
VLIQLNHLLPKIQVVRTQNNCFFSIKLKILRDEGRCNALCLDFVNSNLTMTTTDSASINLNITGSFEFSYFYNNNNNNNNSSGD